MKPSVTRQTLTEILITPFSRLRLVSHYTIRITNIYEAVTCTTSTGISVPRGREESSEASNLTLRRLMSYIYMEHLFLMFLDHTQRRSTVGRTPLDE